MSQTEVDPHLSPGNAPEDRENALKQEIAELRRQLAEKKPDDS